MLLGFGRLHRRKGQTNDAVQVLQRARLLSHDDQAVTGDLLTVLVIAERYAEAEAVVAEALPRKSNGRVLEFDVRLKLNWRGDAAAAAAALERWPVWMFNEDRGVQCAAQVWMWSRQPAKALALLARFPRDYIRHARFTGPRAALTAWLHELTGNTQAALADWKLAIQAADRELSREPTSSEALHWKAWALARLGDRAAAESILRELIERKVSTFGWNEATVGLVALGLVVHKPDWAFAELASIFSEKGRRGSLGFVATRGVLDLNPIFDSVRNDPRFLAIRASAAAPAAGRVSGSGVASPDAKSIAVLAFENLSDDKASEYFSDGISEEVLNVLSKIPRLKVTGRTSAFYFKGKNVAVPDMARQLGVSHLVEGTVRKADKEVRVSARLIQAADGSTVWSGDFREEWKPGFALQDQIAAQIAQMLHVTLGSSAPAARNVNPEALRLVLEGRHFWNQRSAAALARAEALFREAIALEPRFANASAGLADVGQIRMTALINAGDANGARQERNQAQTAAQRAAELDPTLAEPLATLGFLAIWTTTLSEAEHLLQRAIKLNPSLASARRYYAHVLGNQGRLDLALAESKRAADLDPLAFANPLDHARFLSAARRYREALDFSDRALGLQVDGGQIQWTRSISLWGLGRRAEAVEAARSVMRANSRGQGDLEALWILHEAGHREEAAAWAKELDGKVHPESYLRGFYHFAVGRVNDALPFLQEIPRGGPRSYLLYSVAFDSFREDPRFLRLLGQLGCTEEHKVARQTVERLVKQASAAR